jgi:hypothetical protein
LADDACDNFLYRLFLFLAIDNVEAKLARKKEY